MRENFNSQWRLEISREHENWVSNGENYRITSAIRSLKAKEFVFVVWRRSKEHVGHEGKHLGKWGGRQTVVAQSDFHMNF